MTQPEHADALPSASISEILRHIPHRYPFLLIDRVEACVPNKWVRALKNVSAVEASLASVIPQHRRAMPQLLVLEALAQAAGVLCHFSGLMRGIESAVILFAGASSCVYSHDARPGDQLVLECHLQRTKRGVAWLHGTCTVDGSRILDAELSAVIRNLDDLRKSA